MLKNKKGITLIALVITIVVLLVLAGVVVNLSMGENGIISKAQTAVDKYKQAAENEQIELSKLGNMIDGNRNIQGLNLCSPKKLVHIVLPDTRSDTRGPGTFIATSSAHEKTNGTFFSTYLSYDESKGWTVKKTGLYMIYANIFEAYNSTGHGVICLNVNEDEYQLADSYTRDTNFADAKDQYITMILSENDVINFKLTKGNKSSWQSVTYEVYAMFE